jgi:hypothetical protein
MRLLCNLLEYLSGLTLWGSLDAIYTFHQRMSDIDQGSDDLLRLLANLANHSIRKSI